MGAAVDLRIDYIARSIEILGMLNYFQMIIKKLMKIINFFLKC